MSENKLKCSVCGNSYGIIKKNIYVVRVNTDNNIFTPKGNYDACDCPFCGCQHLLKRRYEKATGDMKTVNKQE